MSFEVGEPILNAPFEAPLRHWYIQEGQSARLLDGRRPAMVFQPRDQREDWPFEDGVLRKLSNYERAYELLLVNLIRERLSAWRGGGYPGATRTTLDLLAHWTRDGRGQRLFFAQVEAVETIIFLKEARSDFLQGIDVPREPLSDDALDRGYHGFERYSCKMATGAGKTTVMAMLAAWSILNKVNNRTDARFSDVILVVTPNVTIRDRLRELDPDTGDASIYRTRDLVPSHMMPLLARGRILVTNWHAFQPQTPQSAGGSRVVRAGVRVETTETFIVGEKTTTARGSRYVTRAALDAMQASGELEVVQIIDGTAEEPKKVRVRSVRWQESDSGLVKRVLGREFGGKQNILVMNDEAHHAYRILRDDGEESADEIEEEELEDFVREATVWVEGLDRVQKERGINFCVDLSATPYYLGRVGQATVDQRSAELHCATHGAIRVEVWVGALVAVVGALVAVGEMLGGFVQIVVIGSRPTRIARRRDDGEGSFGLTRLPDPLPWWRQTDSLTLEFDAFAQLGGCYHVDPTFPIADSRKTGKRGEREAPVGVK